MPHESIAGAYHWACKAQFDKYGPMAKCCECSGHTCRANNEETIYAVKLPGEVKMAETTKTKPYGGLLKNWMIDPFQIVVRGNIYNDPQKRWPEGELMKTSGIVKITMETRNSIYELDVDSMKI